MCELPQNRICTVFSLFFLFHFQPCEMTVLSLPVLYGPDRSFLFSLFSLELQINISLQLLGVFEARTSLTSSLMDHPRIIDLPKNYITNRII
jgi:hypothetical protein